MDPYLFCDNPIFCHGFKLISWASFDISPNTEIDQYVEHSSDNFEKSSERSLCNTVYDLHASLDVQVGFNGSESKLALHAEDESVGNQEKNITCILRNPLPLHERTISTKLLIKPKKTTRRIGRSSGEKPQPCVPFNSYFHYDNIFFTMLSNRSDRNSTSPEVHGVLSSKLHIRSVFSVSSHDDENENICNGYMSYEYDPDSGSSGSESDQGSSDRSSIDEPNHLVDDDCSRNLGYSRTCPTHTGRAAREWTNVVLTRRPTIVTARGTGMCHYHGCMIKLSKAYTNYCIKHQCTVPRCHGRAYLSPKRCILIFPPRDRHRVQRSPRFFRCKLLSDKVCRCSRILLCYEHYYSSTDRKK